MKKIKKEFKRDEDQEKVLDNMIMQYTDCLDTKDEGLDQ